jgi:2-amino-4-hydroxy-6-hydroxymethyldihydropteridine diphosphokinase
MVLQAALARLEKKHAQVECASRIMQSAPLGPSRRRYANATAVVRSKLEPVELLALFKRIERKFGRRDGGRRWSSRVLDLDIVLWDGGAFSADGLLIPHPSFRERHFVLRPAASIAPCWRDPVTGLTIRQLYGRLTRPAPLPRAARWSGP